MRVIIKNTAAEAELETAKIIANEIRIKPEYKLGLATGRTMEAVYANLVKMNKAGELDFSLVKTFNLDEYIGLSPDDKNSYHYYMNYHLFSKINIDLRNTHVPQGDVEDVALAAYEFECAMQDAGGVDLQLLGIGRTGHIGFNEPLSSFASRTREVTLTELTYQQNSPLFDNPADMPMHAVTMGVGTILEAGKLLLLATGTEKADIIAKTIEGPITSMISATALQLHPDATVVLDEEAAAKLVGKESYKWMMTH